MSAFKKLVAQMGGQESRDQAVPFGPGQPGLVRPSPISAALPQNAPTEQEVLEHMMGGHLQRAPKKAAPKPPALPPVLAEYLSNTPLNTEVLALPEAEQVIRGLNSGNITVEQLVQQLANPALAQRQRDLILSVLKLRSLGARGQGLPPPMPQQLPRVSPVAQQADPLMLLPQGVPGPAARVSPLMFPPGAPPPHLSVSPAPQAARVPSPQEMTMLTQHIMQQALIKRKLEEQKENYRRRQGDEPQGGNHQEVPCPLTKATSQSGSSSSPLLAFTPTSVMRKTAAERKDSDPRVAVPELKVTAQKEGAPDPPPSEGAPCPPSPGRAITKAAEDREAHRPASLDLRRPPLPSNPLIYLQNNNMAGHINPAMLNQATAMAQQQLAAANLLAHGLDPRLARLPQHPGLPVSPSRSQAPAFPPALPGQQQGGVNLSRFFSPEVLAQANSGTLPAMPPLPTQKVLTLEEIERQAAAVRI